MRIDSEDLDRVGSLDPRVRLRLYLRALLRRWFLIVIPLVAGAALGWSTAPRANAQTDTTGVPVNRTVYYKASHILTVDMAPSAPNVTVEPPNLSQTAYLANTGEVPALVAEELGVSQTDVQDSVIGLPRSEVNSIEITAVGTNPARAEEIADATAKALVDLMLFDSKSEEISARDALVERLDELDAQISMLNAQIAADPPNRSQLEAQLRSVSNEYASVYERFAALAANPMETAGFKTLEAARAKEISKTEYDELRRQIRDGAAYVTGKKEREAEGEAGFGLGGPPEGASRSTRAGIGAAVGFGAGVVLVLVLERFDGRLRRRETVEAVMDLPVIAEIPKFSKKERSHDSVIAVSKPRSRIAEAYRIIRSAVLFADETDVQKREEALVVMVTSPNAGEGKTTTVANLAAVLAEGGLKVLVFNCDFRRPRIHEHLLDLNQEPESQMTIDCGAAGTAKVTSTTIPNVRLVSGLGENDHAVHPLEIVAEQRKIIDRIRPAVDVILLDTAPFLVTNDASGLLDRSDQVLVVTREGKTTVEAAERIVEILGRFDAPTLGVVFNASVYAPRAQYYYGYESDEVVKQTIPFRGRDRESA